MELKTRIKSLEQTISDLVLTSNSQKPIQAESKIMNALEQTQREKAHTSQMIELSQSPRSRNQAINEDILDVIVQESLNK